jgi:Bax protein
MSVTDKIARMKTAHVLIAVASILLAMVLIVWLAGPEKHAVPTDMTDAEKKARFVDLMLPPIRKVQAELEAAHLSAERSMKAGKDLSSLREEYRATTDQQLLAALKPHPASITLAQAATESAWATSRFFVEANNVFGVWSFDPDEPRIAAGSPRGDQTVYVKKYRSLESAVRDYYRVLARGDKFAGFRSMRLSTDDPFKLVKKLDGYSEIGSQYGEDLAAIIRRNEFQQYD